MPVSAVFDNLEAGASIGDIIEQFDLTQEQINAVFEFAARSLDAPPPHLAVLSRCLFCLTEGRCAMSSRPHGNHGERPGVGYAE